MHRRTSIALASIALTLLLAAACGKPLSPEEKVAKERADYTATLNGFVVHAVPTDDAMAGAQDEAMTDETGQPMADQAEDQEMAGEAMDDTAAGEGGEAMPAPTRQDVLLDILVSTTSHELLPHLTVDVEQVDADKNAKGHWLAYLDTSGVNRGPGTQISYTLENVDYADGDGFTVEVRHPVPPEERGQYQEFQEPGSGE